LLLLLLLLLGMLYLIAGTLRAEGIPFVRVDGKSSAKARKDAIQAFAGNSGICI
jgi:SNF2 family DNA or RNA helicase